MSADDKKPQEKEEKFDWGIENEFGDLERYYEEERQKEQEKQREEKK